MLKKTIVYVNPFTDEEVREDHYFHISKADLIEMQMETLNEPVVVDPESGERLEGFRAKLQRIIESNDGVAILEIVKQMIRRSYGKKEGEHFIKSPEVWAEFSSTEAYSQLLFDLCTDADTQADFMNGIMPKNLEEEAVKLAAKAAANHNAAPASNIATVEKPEPRLLTKVEAVEMDAAELQSGLANGRYRLS